MCPSSRTATPVSICWPPEDTPAKHPPEQMGQIPVSPSLLACPLSFLLTCLSWGPQAWALPFTLGILEVAAGALHRVNMLEVPYATLPAQKSEGLGPALHLDWKTGDQGKGIWERLRAVNSQGEGRRKTVTHDPWDYLPAGL